MVEKLIMYKYQIILLGNFANHKETLLELFYNRISDLGIDISHFQIITSANFNTDYSTKKPSCCLYFGDSDLTLDYQHINKLLTDMQTIIPVVNDLTLFSQLVPETLKHINGFQFNDIESLISLLLENFNLLRNTRKLFISYKRDESSTVAIQLYEQFEKCGFDVFLDTHSIRPGEPFQDELWHRMADSDIIVLLNTPGFINSQWTKEELAQANSMGIGIYQLIWPNHDVEREALLSLIYKLQTESFKSDKFELLNNNIMNRITSDVESLRARSLASRRNSLTVEFERLVKKHAKTAFIQPEKYITLIKDSEKIIFIPTIGVPESYNYNQFHHIIDNIKDEKIKSIYLLYDHLNIREKWLKHLNWLDNYLPLKSLKIMEAEDWLIKN